MTGRACVDCGGTIATRMRLGNVVKWVCIKCIPANMARGWTLG